MKKNYLIFGGIAIIILICLMIIMFYPSEQTEISFEFSSSECNASNENPKYPGIQIREVNWIDENTVEVKAYVMITCGNDMEKGTYEIVGNKVNLKPVSVGDSMANCVCGRILTYRFTGLKKSMNYQFDMPRDN